MNVGLRWCIAACATSAIDTWLCRKRHTAWCGFFCSTRCVALRCAFALVSSCYVAGARCVACLLVLFSSCCDGGACCVERPLLFFSPCVVGARCIACLFLLLRYWRSLRCASAGGSVGISVCEADLLARRVGQADLILIDFADEAIFVQDRKLSHGFFPALTGLAPVSSDIAQSQPDEFGCRIVIGEVTSCFDYFA